MPFLFVFQLAMGWQSQKQGVHWPEIRRIAMDTLLVSVVPLALFLFLRERMLDSLPYPPEPHNFVRNPLAHMDLVERFCMGTYVLGYGLCLCLAPFALAADYSHSVFPLVDELTQWRFLIAAAALLLILVGGLWIRRRHPLLFLGMAAFLGFAFVISNIPIVIGTIFGERLYYAPSLGLSFAVAWLWSRLWHRWWVVLSVLLGIWTMLCTVVILQRNVVWQDDKTLFRHEVVNQPQSVRMQLCAASTFAQNDIEQAVHHIRKAMELEPEYANAWGLLGVISSDRRRDRQAEQQLTRSLTARYFDRDTDHFNGHANLGNLFHRQGRFAKAAEHYEKAMRIDPSDMDMFDQLNDMSRSGHLSRMGKDLEAILRQARDAAPYSSYWDGYLGLLAFQTGNAGAARPLLESAVQGIPPGLYGGGPGVTLQLALADCYLAIGKHNRVMPLLSRLASQALKPDVAREAQTRIHAAFGR